MSNNEFCFNLKIDIYTCQGKYAIHQKIQDGGQLIGIIGY